MIRIVADTLSCIPTPIARELDIPYIPQIIIFGDESYRDDTEMDSITFLSKLRLSSTLPKTAAPPPALYIPIFEAATKNSDTVIVVCPSGKLSGTYRSAEVASQDFPNSDIRIIDTSTIAGSLGEIVLLAREWVKQGQDADTIENKIKEISKRVRTYFLVDTLEYLHKGGRIGGAKALIGSLLQVKPILSIEDGQTESYESQRTHKKALSRVIEIVKDQCPASPDSHLCILQGDANEEAQKLAAEFSSLFSIPNIPIYDLPPAVLVHAGPGCIGVSFFGKPE